MFKVTYHFDDNPFKEFLIAVKEFGRQSIAVGVLGGDALQMHPTAKITIGEIAAIQEFGTGHIPPRPMLRETFANRAWVRDTLAKAARDVVTGKKTVRAALNRAGKTFSDGVRMTLLNGVEPANAPATVEWKGHGDTLIGLSSALYDAITHKILGGK